MITPAYCQTMARYGRWQNRGQVAVADALGPAERDRDRGAFFGSVSATMNHLLWGDLIWMSRFDGSEAPAGGIADSPALVPDWEMFKAKRNETDARMIKWAEGLRPETLDGELLWFSGALRREVAKPKALCITHMFNHGTHHRGQVHAMLTAAGGAPGDTDLFIMPETA